MWLFLARRLALLAVTVVAITVVSFIIITLPPGDFVDRIALEAEQNGDPLPASVIRDLRDFYGLDQSLAVQWWKWVSGMVFRGDFGFSFGWDLPVADVIGDRLGLTAVLSILKLMFIWIVAIPIGIYSAVRKYSLGDYVFTFMSFVGLTIPNFLLALVLLYISFKYFRQSVRGLISP
jgi:ABC-type dipeptide/oligopeptide/nickel transport systems, permease components